MNAVGLAKRAAPAALDTVLALFGALGRGLLLFVEELGRVMTIMGRTAYWLPRRPYRFRLLINTVTAVKPQDTPNLPVAKALWTPHPDLETSAKAWIYAGGAHHTGFSFAVKPRHLEMFAEMAGMEYLLIDQDTTVRDFKNELRWNDGSFS